LNTIKIPFIIKVKENTTKTLKFENIKEKIKEKNKTTKIFISITPGGQA